MGTWTITRTNDGATLYNKILSGTATGPLKITRIVACKNTTNFPSDLKTLEKDTLLTTGTNGNYAQDLIVVDVTNNGFSPYDKDHCVISSMLRNDLANSPQEAWELRAIGILVKTDSNDEVLFTIATDSEPDTIPVLTNAPLLSNYTFNIYTGDDGITFESLVVDTSGFVSTTLFEEFKNDSLSKSKGGTVTGGVNFKGSVEVTDLIGEEICSANFVEGGVSLSKKYLLSSRAIPYAFSCVYDPISTEGELGKLTFNDPYSDVFLVNLKRSYVSTSTSPMQVSRDGGANYYPLKSAMYGYSYNIYGGLVLVWNSDEEVFYAYETKALPIENSNKYYLRLFKVGSGLTVDKCGVLSAAQSKTCTIGPFDGPVGSFNATVLKSNFTSLSEDGGGSASVRIRIEGEVGNEKKIEVLTFDVYSTKNTSSYGLSLANIKRHGYDFVKNITTKWLNTESVVLNLGEILSGSLTLTTELQSSSLDDGKPAFSVTNYDFVGSGDHYTGVEYPFERSKSVMNTWYVQTRLSTVESIPNGTVIMVYE